MAGELGRIPRLGFGAGDEGGDNAELLAQLEELGGGGEGGAAAGDDDDGLAELQRELAGLPGGTGGEEQGLLSALRGVQDEAASLERELMGDSAGPLRPGLAERALEEKRRAVALKREGKMAEAREALRRSKALQAEAEASEVGGGGGAGSDASDMGGSSLQDASRGAMSALEEANAVLRASVNLQSTVESEENCEDPEILESLRKLFNAADPAVATDTAPAGVDPRQLEAQAKAAKLKAVALKRSGDLDGAREALRHSKDLQAQLQGLSASGGEGGGSETQGGDPGMSAVELRRKAVELRRQGDMVGARAALRAAKAAGKA